MAGLTSDSRAAAAGSSSSESGPCPTDAQLLAWLQEAGDVDRQQPLTDHLNACDRCQNSLAQLCQAEERQTELAAGDGLLDDLRRQVPPDELESEPESIQAVTLAEAACQPTAAAREAAREPSVADVDSLARRGQYEILEVLGTGGMGVVYKAKHIRMSRLVAIKVLPPVKTLQTEAIARFEREMKAVARLSHPNIVSAYDADETDGKQFLVMEFIDGLDLKSLVKEHGPLPVDRAVDYVIQAARGLHYAHEQGIVHRDIKPANLMLDRGGTVKVLDLGLASCESLGELQADLTDTGMLMGTVDYLAPEQAANIKDVDRRADIYSLGCSLYYLLTGQALHKGDTVIQKVLAHREQPTPSLRAACSDMPAWLEQVFAKMVAKRPDERYQTMAEVIADLKQQTLLSPPSVGNAFPGLPSVGNAFPGLPSVGNALRGVPRGGVTPSNSWRPKNWQLISAVGAMLVLIIAAIGLPPIINRWQADDEAGVPREGSDPEEQETPDAPHDKQMPLTRGAVAGQEWNGNDLHMKFCWCPPGKFLMGSPANEPGRAEFESPPVDVVLSRGFWLGKFEVTQDEWEQVMGTRPSRFQGAETLPVENVSWEETVEFCKKLTSQQRERGTLPADWEFRLPTEAQWEYACRAGGKTAYSFGPTSDKLGDYAWHATNAEFRTHQVGGKKPNPWGLHDMHGNVWEWCGDWYLNKLPGGVDPEVIMPGTARVMRSGGWNADPELCRTAFRSGQEPDKGAHVLGFRVALVQVADQTPTPGEAMLPGRWYDLLAVVPTAGNWNRTSAGLLQSPPVENQVIQVPVAIAGSYQLQASFTRLSGERSVNYYFPIGERVGILYLDFDSVDSLVIDGKEGSQSPVKSAPMALKTGRRYDLAINITLREDQATIEIDLDEQRHLQWTGAQSRLPAGSTSGRFALGSRDGDTAFHELRVRLLEADE